MKNIHLTLSVLVSLALISLIGWQSAALAQTPRELKLRADMASKAEELSMLQEDIALTSDREAELMAEVDALENSRATINSELIETAQRAHKLESNITNAEGRLDSLFQTEEVIRLSLIKRRAVLGEILATLQRMGRAPPPALLVKPEDVLSAIRSAMMVGSVLPDVRAQAEALTNDLEELVAVRAESETATEKLRQSYQSLSEEQTRLALLLDEKRSQVTQSTVELELERQTAKELAEEAGSLKDLISSMETKITAVRQARDDAIKAAEDARRQAAESAIIRTQEAKLKALKNQGRITPAIPFEETVGLLPLPVSGALITSFGEKDNQGGTSPGLNLSARAGNSVISPADGWVVYAGPFRTYGQLLIINAGDEYHWVLAGMENINVQLGQFVLSGEPVATMGTRKLASLAVTGTSDGPKIGSNSPVLYVELRKDGISIDPSPWWVVGAVKQASLGG